MSIITTAMISAAYVIQLGITSEPYRLDQSLACMQRAQELHPTSVEVCSTIHSNTYYIIA
jgi:hypothetical protein